jgi:hypothetical protein
MLFRSQIVIFYFVSLALFTCAGLCHASGVDTAWRAIQQPELKQALERASGLQTESLGEPTLGANVWERWR